MFGITHSAQYCATVVTILTEFVIQCSKGVSDGAQNFTHQHKIHGPRFTPHLSSTFQIRDQEFTYHFFAAASRQNLRLCLCQGPESNLDSCCSWNQSSTAKLWIQPNVLQLCSKSNELKQNIVGVPNFSLRNVHRLQNDNDIHYKSRSWADKKASVAWQ